MQELALVMAGERLDAPEEQLVLLVKRAKSGDIAAFEEILGRYERQVLGTALRLLGRNLEDAKDAATDTGVKKDNAEHGHLKPTEVQKVSDSCQK